VRACDLLSKRRCLSNSISRLAKKLLAIALCHTHRLPCPCSASRPSSSQRLPKAKSLYWANSPNQSTSERRHTVKRWQGRSGKQLACQALLVHRYIRVYLPFALATQVSRAESDFAGFTVSWNDAPLRTNLKVGTSKRAKKIAPN
jgi:hypothetical protein